MKDVRKNLSDLKLQSPLSRRQLRLGFVVALVIGLIVCTVQAAIVYVWLEGIYTDANNRVIDSAKPIAGKAVYEFDTDLAEAVLTSMMVQRSVAQAEISTRTGFTLAARVRDPRDVPHTIWADILFGGAHDLEIPLFSELGTGERHVPIGTLAIRFDPQIYVNAFFHRMTISGIAILTFAVAMAFSLVAMSYRTVTRPLLMLADFVLRANPMDGTKPLPAPPRYDHDDEMQLLSSSIVGLMGLVRGKVRELTGVQQELKSMNQSLEARVAQRNQELHDAIDKLEEQASTDPLTGLANRRAFMGRAKNAVAIWQRRGTSVGEILIDIDHFKQLNDRYGHQGGDAVLRSFAKTLTDNLRDTDFAARVGGEEFAILVSGEDAEGLATAAERFRVAVENDVVIYNGRKIRYTASMGVALLPDESNWAVDRDKPKNAREALSQAREAEDLINLLYSVADRGLYRAKERGRNRCEVGKMPDSVQRAGE